jgi:hypothetical protein
MTSRPAIVLVDQFGEDPSARKAHETQYDMKLSTIPEGISLLVTYVSGDDNIVQVMHEGIRYWVDTAMIKHVTEE